MATGHSRPDPVKPTIARTMGKARIFSEAMPFIKEYRGTTVVIKYGGSAMVDDALRNTFADDVAMLHYVGIKPVIVHGGGSAISRAMSQRGLEQFGMNRRHDHPRNDRTLGHTWKNLGKIKHQFGRCMANKCDIGIDSFQIFWNLD